MREREKERERERERENENELIMVALTSQCAFLTSMNPVCTSPSWKAG